MLRNFILIIVIITNTNCKTSKVTLDYFGQPEPKTIPVIFGEDVISKKGRFEHGLSFTPDTRELAFGIFDKNADRGSILYAKRVNNKWTTPENFRPLKNESVYLPYFAPNGKSLLYTKSIPDTNSLYITNIWKIENIDGKWNSPQKIKPPINSLSREATASMTNDGTIYFSSNRNCEGKENCYTADLFRSRLINNEHESVEYLSALNSSNDEESIFISSKEEYILFCRYNDDETFVDLFISYRNHNDMWTQPQVLDKSINSNDWERRPFVSFDNKFLFFTRLKIEEYNLIESDIYWVNTSKIFKPYVYNPPPVKKLKVGEKFELQIPQDYFKDIGTEQLTLNINNSEFDWLEFDRKEMKLLGTPTLEGKFELVFTAIDEANNITKDKLEITVTR